MYALIQPFVNLLLNRGSAQDIPASPSVFKFVAISCFITDVISSMSTLGFNTALVLSAGQIGLLSVFVYFLLNLKKKPERWLQTISAILGALALINVASIPFLQNLNFSDVTQLTLSPSLLVVGALQLWFFIIMARILRDAVEVTMGRALLYTFLIINAVPIVLSAVVGILGISPAVIK
ncbi:MAG: hypothetical protein V3V09_01560 [Arenicellales bacterium]